MALPKFIFTFAVGLFLLIGGLSLLKSSKPKEIIIAPKTITEVKIKNTLDQALNNAETVINQPKKQEPAPQNIKTEAAPDMAVDRIDRLFAADGQKLPIVQTITYTSRAPWLKGRPAWIADYAAHYNTSRHFIARSLNQKADYFTQNVSPGDKFNVLKENLNFYLVVDLSETRLWFFALDLDTNERFLIKSYKIGVGRKDSKKSSGFLTPKGRYLLGEKVAIYKLGSMGYFQGRQIEMIRVFGTRWIPFEKELEGATMPAKGFGLHGAPWINDAETEKLMEDRQRIGTYDSDGCIRLYSEDMEELFAIIISKPTIVEIVDNFAEADFPGTETVEQQR